jgi:hypothetical protein
VNFLGASAPCTYTSTIAFTNTSNGQGNTIRTATLTVNPRTKDESHQALKAKPFRFQIMSPEQVAREIRAITDRTSAQRFQQDRRATH